MEEHPPLRAAVAAAIRNRSLRLWLLGVFLCGALDEVLVAFAALHLRERLGAGVGQAQRRPDRLHGGHAGRPAGHRPPVVPRRPDPPGPPLGGREWVTPLGLVFAPGLASSAALLALVVCAPRRCIRSLRACLSALPGASGMVNAAQSLLVPLDLALPLVLAFSPDRRA